MLLLLSPNQLTMLRMALVPLLILLIVYGYPGWALVVFAAAGITDMLDGLIARRLGKKTPLGTFLDPIADKLLLVSSFTALSSTGLDLHIRIPVWLTITVISRDLLLVLSVLIFNLTMGKRLFTPSMLGKCTTVMQLFMVMVVLFGNFLLLVPPGVELLAYGTLGLTVASGLHYMFHGMQLFGKDWAGINKA